MNVSNAFSVLLSHHKVFFDGIVDKDDQYLRIGDCDSSWTAVLLPLVVLVPDHFRVRVSSDKQLRGPGLEALLPAGDAHHFQ